VWVYGPTSFDQTHILVINYIWELPNASKRLSSPGAKFVAHHLLDNWAVSGVSSFATGFPRTVGLTLSDGSIANIITGGGDGARANVIAKAKLSGGSKSFTKYFNTAAFARPAVGTYGNEPTGDVRAPGVNNWDITLMKHITLKSETRFLEFRAEFYNAFNHSQFSAIDTTARFTPAGAQVNGRFGAITASRPPRTIQFGLKFAF
jgi:hypothetical protein